VRILLAIPRASSCSAVRFDVNSCLRTYDRMISAHKRLPLRADLAFAIFQSLMSRRYIEQSLFAVMKACRQNVCATITAVELSLFKLPPLWRLCAGYLLYYRAFLHLINWPETFGPRRPSFSNYSFLSFPRRDGGGGEGRGTAAAKGAGRRGEGKELPDNKTKQGTTYFRRVIKRKQQPGLFAPAY